MTNKKGLLQKGVVIQITYRSQFFNSKLNKRYGVLGAEQRSEIALILKTLKVGEILKIRQGKLGVVVFLLIKRTASAVLLIR